MIKKFTVCVCSLCLILALCFTACGFSYAKIKGIGAGIGTEETEAFEYNNALLNAQTVFDHDYILRTNAEYIFGETYYASGGSIYPVMNAENIKLFYDESVLEIVQM